MTADSWEGPACSTCKGKGEIVLTGKSWVGVQCVDCRGTGLAAAPPPGPRYREDGYQLPQDGEEYDAAVHGPISAGCWLCGGEGALGAARKPCPACSPRKP